MFKCKTRMVTFRLSEEEFQTFRKVCIAEGFGSFSELIRVAVQGLIADRRGCSPEALRNAVEKLNARLEEVGRDVRQLRASPAEAGR